MRSNGYGAVQANPAGGGMARLAILGVGGFALYRFAQSGGLGPTAQSFANSLWGAASSTQLPSVQVGPGTVAVTGPGGTATVNRRPMAGCPPFTPGVNYVADMHDATFETVIGGVRVFLGDQASAESVYRTKMGCS